jgi:hypothetical protein
MNGAKPPGSHELGNATRIITVGLVALRAKACTHMAGFQTRRRQACFK